MSKAVSNKVGRVFAAEVQRPDLWPEAGPTEELRRLIALRELPTRSLVLLGIALDFFDSTRAASLWDAMRQLQAPDDGDALVLLAEFVSAGMSGMDGLEKWADLRLGTSAK